MGKDTTNLSKLQREKLLAAIKEIKEGITDPDKITALNEIENELLEMKYGLKWEKHEEQVDRDLLTKIPVFKEDKEREIVKTEGEFNFLLEGDNLHSLMLLEKTHKNAIDVITIDPPYNTLNEKGFKYNDKKIDSNDDFRHSKWLSFMERRLRVAYELLKDDGILFVNIDDNELYNLKLLIDAIFGERNFIANLIWKKKATNGGSSTKGFTINSQHEYILVITKNIKGVNLNGVKGSEDLVKKYKHKDERGYFRYIDFAGYGLSYVSSMDYVIINPNGEKVRANDVMGVSYNARWRWGKEKYEAEKDSIVWINGKPKTKTYLDGENIKLIHQSSLMDDKEFLSNTNSDLLDIFGRAVFDNPKPKTLIERLISLHPNKNATILDFFAGSGTTGHAVLELNREDGGNRKFILCTNNEVGEAKEKEFKKLHGDKEDHPDKWAAWEEEHGIARSVTYKRLEKVINGYTTPKGKEVEGIPANLKYYKTEYIPREMEDDDYDAHEEINKYIIELIQLEFAIDIHNPKIGLVLSDEYMESENFNVKEIDDKKLNEVEDIYIAEGLILPDGLQEKISKRGIRLHWVPQYYKF